MIDNDWDLFETGALPKLAMDNQLMAFKHEYFWKPMDTLREKNELEKLSLDEIPPWLDFSHF
jgi:glucose-1-phosphate cytidylyltransferase